MPDIGGFFGGVVIGESGGVFGSVMVGIPSIGLEKGLMQSNLHVSVHPLTTMRGKFVEYVQGQWQKWMRPELVKLITLQKVGDLNHGDRFSECRIRLFR